jgi:drug/metabolite transporter (DMT)-like permease
MMIDKNSQITGALLVMTAAILWGLDGVILTPRLFNLDVRFIVMVLHAIPFLFFSALLSRQFKTLSGVSLKDWSNFILIAVTGGVIGTLAIVKALMTVHFQPLSVVVLLQKLQPVFAVFLAVLILGERPGLRFCLPAAIALVASYFLTFGWKLPDMGRDGNTVTAGLYALVAAISFGSATTLGKKALIRHKPETVLFARYGLTTLIMIPVVLFSGKMVSQLQAATPLNWGIFLVTAATTGSGAIFIYYLGMKRISASTATFCELLFPVTAVLFDMLVNKARLSPVQLVGAGVLTACIVFISLAYRSGEPGTNIGSPVSPSGPDL